jgi:hypothetical protein
VTSSSKSCDFETRVRCWSLKCGANFRVQDLGPMSEFDIMGILILFQF